MTKILAQAGISLADIYDIAGSIVGVEQLQSQEVSLVHEMGQTVFSERLTGTILRISTGNLLQNVTFGFTLTAPAGVCRVLGVSLFTDVAARLINANLSLRDSVNEREMPLFIWDSTNDIESTMNIDDDGTVGDVTALVQTSPQPGIPNLVIGSTQRQSVGDLMRLRGTTAGFGAGNVVVTAIVYFGFASTTSISSFGVAIPGW